MSDTGSMEEIHVEQTPTPTAAQLASKALMMESENLDVTNFEGKRKKQAWELTLTPRDT